jgi:DDE superfamily endonuclease
MLASQVRAALSDAISFLLTAIPPRSRRTFAELLCACLVSPTGWMTQAISAITRECHWTTYYKLIERANWNLSTVSTRLVQLLLQVCPQRVVTLIIDDTLVPRTSTRAPGVAIRHDHAQRANRPRFLNAQCWVTLAMVLRSHHGSATTVPLRSLLVDAAGQCNKLAIALRLIRGVRGQLSRVRVLFDSWYMRRRLLLPLIQRHVQFLGQVRRDTALFLPPSPKGKPRGRPRKYGARLTPQVIAALPCSERTLWMYGKEQRVRLCTIVVRARFLRGHTVRAVWCEFFDARTGHWSTPRLLLASEIQLSAESVVRIYAKRWGIEPLFHNLKRWWGIANLWQQSHRALQAWMQVRCLAYALAQLLAIQFHDAFPMMDIAPWRRHRPTTAGLIGAWLRRYFCAVRLRHAYDPKSQKFTMPEPLLHAHPRL